ncbi:MAG: rRNA (adenine1518-N6/adenine1519-N6)-dimethyltransferase [Blastocatellia bacterium]|jgi:16S rRNA (adenine1518-N6/adenine1519-N6)-dimethyltransferase|nr:rRNA (adenine1518-N6/adenine1519-N6)-dimethyltransferase [Blastocatellia bacterium]
MSRGLQRPSTKQIHSKKRLGQNFLVDSSVVARITQAVRPRPDETIIEIGPGRGALTKRLVELAGQVIAIEFDRDLIPHLRAQFSAASNFRLVEDDALIVNFCDLLDPGTRGRVVANLPYNIATAILQRLIAQRNCIAEMVLMLQREVVERMIAPPSSPERGFLSLLVEAHCDAEKLFDIPPGAFRPAPKVWSSVIRLTVHDRGTMDIKNEELLWQVVSAGFAQRRKTILNNLRTAPAQLQEVLKSHGGASIVLCQAEVELQRRAETLTLSEWQRITTVLL